jgi:hypothetical protein
MQPWDAITDKEATHPSDDQLASFFDPALPPEALEALASHIDSCRECELRFDQIEPALSQYRRCQEAVHARIERPARRDAELWAEMERLEANRVVRRSKAWRFAWAGAIAAALVVGMFLFFPAGRGSELRAETLLARAATATAQSRSNHQLRIRTRTVSFVRPAVRHGETAEETAIGQHFAAAHYDWRDPLNPQSYSNWRNGLKRKTSKISARRDERTGQLDQRIETTTQDGPLVDASLVLDTNLVPVGGWFRFADQEWVEISAVPEAAPEPTPEAANDAAPVVRETRSSLEERDLLERDLTVRLAIDALHPGASEPIEVTAEPAREILVTTYRLAPERLKELEASLKKIDGVTLRAVDQASPIADHTDGLPRASQEVSFEAHYLAELASRFDPVVTMLNVTMLSAASQAKLLALETRHAAQLTSDLTTLRHELEQERFDFADRSPAEPSGAETRVLADSAAAVDRLVTELYSGAEIAGDPATLRRDLALNFARLEHLADGYSRRLDQAQAQVRRDVR